MSNFTKTFVSMQKKQHLLKAFDVETCAIIETAQKIFKDHHAINTYINLYSLFKKYNPKLVIQYWHACLYTVYKSHINLENNTIDIEFLTTHDFAADFKDQQFAKFTARTKELCLLTIDVIQAAPPELQPGVNFIYTKILSCSKISDAYVKIDEK